MPKNYLSNFAAQNGLSWDAKRGAAYGMLQEYRITALYLASKQYLVNMNVHVEEPERVAELAAYLNGLLSTYPALNHANYQNNTITISVKSEGAQDVDTLSRLLQEIAGHCRYNNYANCCKQCGSTESLSIYGVGGQCETLCSDCFDKYAAGLAQASAQKKDNPVAGVAGALLGSLIGVVLWVAVYQIGFIAGIVGFVMAVCCIGGYQKFSGKLTKTGLILSIVIAIVMLFAAEYISVGIEIYTVFKEYDVSFTIISGLRAVPTFLGESEILSAMLKDLAIGYVLMAISSVGYIRNVFRKTSNEQEAVRLV